MPSPFPGMDPYIEASGLWEDFHDDLIHEMKRALADSLSDRYLVRTRERSYIVLVGSEGKESHPFIPDVSLTSPKAPEVAPGASGEVAVAEPATEGDPVSLRPFIEEEFRETFLEIYEAGPEQRLVTSIEVLSPSNKRRGSEGRELYLRKRQALLLGEANLMEIDLLRGGERMPMLDPWPNSPYVIMVARVKRVPRCLVWRGHYRRPLPPIPVPLANPDPDVTLNLQPMLAAGYARSRYARSIDYSRPLNPPLTDEDATWLAAQLQAQQART